MELGVDCAKRTFEINLVEQILDFLDLSVMRQQHLRETGKAIFKSL